MAKVKNRQIVSKIAMRSIASRKSRNLIAVLAIALTALLFTSLFTIGGSIIQKMEESTMRQVGTSYYAGYKYLTWEQYEKCPCRIAARVSPVEAVRYTEGQEKSSVKHLKKQPAKKVTMRTFAVANMKRNRKRL